MRDNKYLTKIVASCVMGNSEVKSAEKKVAFLELNKPEVHLDYLTHLQTILQDITSVRIKDNILKTSNHPFFKKFRERCYLYSRKVIDPHYLTLLDWEMVSFLYMDRGSFSKIVEINTNLYSYGDNILLKRAIKEKLGIEFNIKDDRSNSGALQYKMVLRKRDANIFMENIEKFVVPSYMYKISRTEISSIEDDEIV